MNIFSKIFCRIYQTGFRLAMPILPYRRPKVRKKLDDICVVLNNRKIDSVLLVTDAGIRLHGLTAPLEQSLADNGIQAAVYDRTNANPTVHNVEEAYKMYCENHCKALIAFGGGSSMDCAKAVGARVRFPQKTVGQMKGLLRVWKRLPLLIAVPTTAGTGSEVTITAVITDSEKKHKYTMNNFTFIPRFAVLDPKVTYSLPPFLTATTGMDALTHAVEAYIGGSTTNETRELALQAVELIYDNIETAYLEPTNYRARGNMLKAAYKAGIAFSKSYVGYIHAVAHSLGGQYNIPHGLANSVLMPIVLEAYGPAVYKKLAVLADAAGIIEGDMTEEEAAKLFIQSIRDLNKRMSIPETLKGIQKEDIPQMAKHAAAEANPLYPVPVLYSAKQLEQFYHIVSGTLNEMKAE